MKVLNSYRKSECMEASRLMLESDTMHSLFLISRKDFVILMCREDKNANDSQKC